MSGTGQRKQRSELGGVGGILSVEQGLSSGRLRGQAVDHMEAPRRREQGERVTGG